MNDELVKALRETDFDDLVVIPAEEG